MIDESKLPDMSAKIGQMIRSNELKMAGKLLATARNHLHQLAEKDDVYELRYERIALLRNELMEPGGSDFDEQKLLAEFLNEEKQLHQLVTRHPSEPLLMAQTLLRTAAAVVLVYAQDMASGAPLEI